MRSFLMISLLGLSLNSLYPFQQSAIKKTRYEFTDTRISEADTLLKKRQYQEALTAYQKAYDTYEAEEFYEGMVYAMERMGRTYRSLRKDSLSQHSYSTAARLSREKLGPNHILESKAYLNNGIRAHFKSQFVSASNYFDSAMSKYTLANSYDSSMYKSLIDFKFYSYYYSDKNRDTLIQYLNARSKFYESNPQSANDRVYLLSDHARAFYRRGEYQKSVAYGMEATRVAELLADSLDNFYQSDALLNLGRALNQQKDYEQALIVANKLVAFTLSNTPQSRSLLGYLNLKGVILNGLERYDEAIDVFETIISSLEERNEFNRFYRTTVMNLGVCYLLMGNNDKSKAYLFASLTQEKENGGSNDPILSNRYKYIGQYYSSIDNPKMALMYYDSALRSYVNDYHSSIFDYPEEESINPTYEALNLMKNKILSLNKVGMAPGSDKARYFESSIRYVEKTHDFLVNNRQELQGSGGRLFLSESFKSMYGAGIEACYQLYQLDAPNRSGYFASALEMFNHSKSILFLEQSGELGLIQQSNLSQKIKGQYFSLVRQMDSLESNFEKLIERRSFGDSIRNINSALLITRKELSEIQSQIPADILKNENSSEELRHSILEKLSEGAFIEYFLAESYVYIVSFTKGQSVFKRVQLTEGFHSDFDEFMNLVRSRPNLSTYAEDLQRYQNVAFSIYQTLLGPILEDLGTVVPSLTIVPDEKLSQLPFDALVNNTVKAPSSYLDLSFVINNYSVNYALSSSRVTSAFSQKRARKGLLGIGYSGAGQTELRSEYGDLPGTELEIEFLRSNFDGDYVLGELGTKEFFLKNAGNYDILHLAIHGESDNDDRFKSSLIFNGVDGELSSKDLYSANLNARLAILSACESGVGQVNKGEGTFSIARGFALVGVPSLVMSLWKVNDQVASDLMVSFHDKLNSGMPVNSALSSTKRGFLEKSDKYTSHPYYWSAFVSMGEEIELSSIKWYARPWGLAILFFVFFVAVMLPFKWKKRKGAK